MPQPPLIVTYMILGAVGGAVWWCIHAGWKAVGIDEGKVPYFGMSTFMGLIGGVLGYAGYSLPGGIGGAAAGVLLGSALVYARSLR